MRTTVTLDPDVERLLKDEAHRTRKSFKAVLNESVRQVLNPKPAKMPKMLPPSRMGKFLVDPGRLNQLADELEIEAHLEVMRRNERKRAG
jgi:hypothetical protein